MHCIFSFRSNNKQNKQKRFIKNQADWVLAYYTTLRRRVYSHPDHKVQIFSKDFFAGRRSEKRKWMNTWKMKKMLF
ncbi:MAG TPA: hypothetical protein DDW33_08975 [Ktedonobacter sp.]|nr:hypothetical protein [Ktedonobacter sp.]HBE25803.1 hypothetical protein [Ktedonobacter sp.]HCJ34251.1 hypothetical protein [Ktedonobacter sp.]